MADLTKGEIYLIRNKVNGKGYVGQASKYVGKNNQTWGTVGRWKSHLREAFQDVRDHCVLLNNALRKYGEDAFEVTKLCECDSHEMNDMEVAYIDEHNTLTPHGYNSRQGGSNGKASEESRQKMSDFQKNRPPRTEETMRKISQSQMGNRREVKRRKYDEDNDLPKYISATRKNGTVNGYSVAAFPIGVHARAYADSKVFTNAAHPNSALEAAKQYLEHLKQKYEHVSDELRIKRTATLNVDITKKMEALRSDRLPENVFVIITDAKISGYFVDGLQDFQGNPVPRKSFTENKNNWNLDKAKRFIQQVNLLNTAKTVVTNWDDVDTMTRNTKAQADGFYLPRYLTPRVYKGATTGFCIQGLPLKNDAGDTYKYYKNFNDKHLPLQQKYDLAIQHLNEMTALQRQQLEASTATTSS
jgi:group I intron endonuclease